jgi:hypothetical protein
MSGNVVIDPRFWKGTSDYLSKSGVVTYEQDWLNQNAQTEVNLTDPSAFLGEMAHSMAANNITVQYCMPVPSDYMASTLYPNVQTIRTSGDGFQRRKWDQFLYDSRLAYALGLWPWTDAVFSKDLGNLIISTLSAGPVGVGDALGETNAANLRAAVRSDGVIVKPDTPLLPIDQSYIQDAQSPMVATASTDFGSIQALYVFAYPRRSSDSAVTVPLKSLGLSRATYSWNWTEHRGELISPNGSVHMNFADGWAYDELFPLTSDGMALLGDTEKITSLGKTRIASLHENGGLSFTVRFAPNETTCHISGYAPRRPHVKALSGEVRHVQYDEETHIFVLDVSSGKSHQATIWVRAE